MIILNNVQTSKNKIENKILKSPRGILFFAEDFTNYGTPENIRQVLSRLEKESVLVRLAHGIYVKPKIDPLLGTILPTAEHVAVEISKRDVVFLLALTASKNIKTRVIQATFLYALVFSVP